MVILPGSIVQFAQVANQLVSEVTGGGNLSQLTIHIHILQGHNVAAGHVNVTGSAGSKDIHTMDIAITLDVDIVGHIVAIFVIIENLDGLPVEVRQVSRASVSGVSVTVLQQELGGVAHMSNNIKAVYVNNSAGVDIQSDIVGILEGQTSVPSRFTEPSLLVSTRYIA